MGDVKGIRLEWKRGQTGGDTVITDTDGKKQRKVAKGKSKSKG